MRSSRFTQPGIGFLILALLGPWCGHAWADCSTRHIYNETDTDYVVSLTNGSCTVATSTEMQSQCLVRAFSNAELHYANNALSDALRLAVPSFPADDIGIISVVSNDGGLESKLQKFGVQRKNSRCYIRHPTDTGLLVMNDPTDGDIRIECRGECIKLRTSAQATRIRQQAERSIPSKGNYRESCTNPRIDGDVFLADCKNLFGQRVSSSLQHAGACRGNVDNVDGHLVCIDLKTSYRILSAYVVASWPNASGTATTQYTQEAAHCEIISEDPTQAKHLTCGAMP